MGERLSRLRRTSGLREIFQETRLDAANLVYPVFVQEGIEEPVAIESMPGQARLPVSVVGNVATALSRLGVRAMLVFGLPARKDSVASAALDSEGVVPRAIREIKAAAPEMVVITDVCVCGYTDHGHCGILGGEELDTAATQALLEGMAVVHAAAGADMVAPSSMVDGQVGAIRTALDGSGHLETAILAYSAKFASSFYGPFREAADSAPSFGDRRAYQHDAANGRHALRELRQDVLEGADALMVKPGLPYLDVLARARAEFDLPLAAYHVSGEYAMVKAAAERGWVDERAVVMESMLAFRRAGADLIITYFAPDVARWLREGHR
jgi:porphobilinogen synthase